MTFRPTVRRRSTELDRVFDAFFNGNNLASSAAISNTSSVNVKENEDAFFVELAAPGWKKKDFELEVKEETLTIKASREKAEKEGEKYLRREFQNNSLKRVFNLPETVDVTKIKAQYKNGVLTISLPKKPEAKPLPPRQIEVA